MSDDRPSPARGTAISGSRRARPQQEPTSPDRALADADQGDLTIAEAIGDVYDPLAVPGADEETPEDLEASVTTLGALSHDTRTALFHAAVTQIDNYVKDGRRDELRLAAGLTREQRMALHRVCDMHALYHRSEGVGADGKMLIVSAIPLSLEPLRSYVGEGAIGYLVERPSLVVTRSGAATVQRGIRGEVTGFDEPEKKWLVEYADSTTEKLDLAELNKQLKQRWLRDETDAGAGASADGAEATAEPMAIDNSEYEKELAEHLKGVLEDWATNSAYSFTKYDARHFIENFCNMSAATKTSQMYKIFIVAVSDALFRILPGERYRILKHVRKMGMTKKQIKNLRRRYWRLRARYSSPEPSVIIKGLFDVYVFFRDMPDPDCETRKFFKHDHADIFKKEIKYVQLGLLSDPPGVCMYYKARTCKTGLVIYRCIRGTSALEGYHLHLRASRDPRARHAGPRLQHSESMWFDWRWNIMATIEAGLMPAIGHEYLWLRDLLADLLRDTPLGRGVGQIPELAGWHRIDTSREPRVPRGLRSVPLRDSSPPIGQPAPRQPSSLTAGRYRNRSLPSHSQMSATDWVKVARQHSAPVSPHDHPTEALSDISALMNGDSARLFQSTGMLFTSGELAAFANIVESRVRTQELLHQGDLAGLRSSLRTGGSARAAPLLADQTAVPVQQPTLGVTGALPLAPFAAAVPAVTVAPRAAASSAGAAAAAPAAAATMGAADEATRKRRQQTAIREASRKQRRIDELGGGG